MYCQHKNVCMEMKRRELGYLSRSPPWGLSVMLFLATASPHGSRSRQPCPEDQARKPRGGRSSGNQIISKERHKPTRSARFRVFLFRLSICPPTPPLRCGHHLNTGLPNELNVVPFKTSVNVSFYTQLPQPGYPLYLSHLS